MGCLIFSLTLFDFVELFSPVVWRFDFILLEDGPVGCL